MAHQVSPSSLNHHHTMATTGLQWLRSDNKQIKWSQYKRFIASHSKGRPWSSLQAQLTTVNNTWSPFVLLRASPPSKGLNIKIQMKLGESFKQPSKRKAAPVLFITTANYEAIIPFLCAPAIDLRLNTPTEQVYKY